MHYDDDEVLTRFVLDHYGHSMTQLESRAIRAIRAEAKAMNSQDERLAAMIRKRFGGIGDDEVAAALEPGEAAFRRGVRERLLREHKAEIIINRCPRCDRIVRTPAARQCHLVRP